MYQAFNFCFRHVLTSPQYEGKIASALCDRQFLVMLFFHLYHWKQTTSCYSTMWKWESFFSHFCLPFVLTIEDKLQVHKCEDMNIFFSCLSSICINHQRQIVNAQMWGYELFFVMFVFHLFCGSEGKLLMTNVRVH